MDHETRDRRFTTLTAPVVGELIKTFDFCLILAASFISYLFYLVEDKRPFGGGLGRYALPSVLGALFFVVTMDNISGYDLQRLRRVYWQIPRIFYVWSFVGSLLLALAFLGKLSAMYSRFWALSWAMFALFLISTQRGLLCLLS